jgi:heptaprenyl diphosphate synthase
MKTRRLVSLALMAALSVGLHYIESVIPSFLPVPGFRLGLANIITLFVLYYYGGISYVFVTLVKVFTVALITSGFSIQFLMSLSGSLISMAVSLLLYYTLKPSIYSVSFMGSLAHTIGQLLCYALFFHTFGIFMYISILGPLSLVTGFIMAVLVRIMIERLPKSFRTIEQKHR